MMYKSALLTLLTATALAFPTPQSLLTGISSVFTSPSYLTSPRCIGGASPCIGRFDKHDKSTMPTGKSTEREKIEQSLAVRQETGENKAGVFYCKDVGWGGDCIYRKTPLGSDPKDCTPLNMEVSSVGPDEGYYCIFFTNAVCAPIASDQSDTLSLTYPGTDNLVSTAKGNYNDRLLSYQCFRNETYALDPMEKSRADAFEEAKGNSFAEGRVA